MRTLSIWDVKSIGSRIMVGLVFAALLSSIYVTSALAKDDRHYKQKDNRSRYDDKENKNNKGHYYNRGRKEDQRHYGNKGHKGDQRHYGNKGHKGDQRHYDNKDRRYGRYQHKGYDCYRIVKGRRIYQPCRNRGPAVYTPPRVIFEPPEPPGINVFFPPIFFPFHR